jgi:hypothetical protein
MPARAEYRALGTIQVNGVNAYQAGDDVYATAVESLGLEVGVDVEPSGEKVLEKPAKNASRAAWAAYAVDQGVSADDLEDLGRDEIVALFEEKAEEPDGEEAGPAGPVPAGH